MLMQHARTALFMLLMAAHGAPAFPADPPAATLLLPYFEVDAYAPIGSGPTTLFTITNTSRYPQIAHVTLWTDWAFPVLGFNLFLTGYDVQAINLYDVIVRGIIAP